MSYSPTEEKVVASIWRKNLGWNLEIFDISTRQWSFLSHDRFIQNHPIFSEDGNSVIYSADNDGVYNVYQIQLSDNQNTKLTNVLGGAFYPGVSKNGLYYLGYQPEGYDLFHISSQTEIATSTLQLAEAEEIMPVELIQKAEKEYQSQTEQVLPAEDYSPWESVTPTWWLPYFLIDDQRTEIGAQTFGNDALYRHLYSAFLAYDVENEWLTGSFDYFYDGFWPVIHFGLSRTTDLFLDSNDDPIRIRDEDLAQLEVIVPFTSLDNDWFIHTAISTERNKDIWTSPSAPAAADTREDYVGLGLRYVSAHRYPLSVSRSEGREVRLIYEDSDVIGSSDLKGQVLVGDWREFIHIGREHVLGLRLVEARGEDNSSLFRLGGIQSGNLLSFGAGTYADIFNERNYSLRGYDEGPAQLTGQNMRLFSAEYRFPMWRIEHGWMSPPFGFNQIHGEAHKHCFFSP